MIKVKHFKKIRYVKGSFLWATQTLTIPEKRAIIIGDLLCIRFYFEYIQSQEAFVSFAYWPLLIHYLKVWYTQTHSLVTDICSELYWSSDKIYWTQRKILFTPLCEKKYSVIFRWKAKLQKALSLTSTFHLILYFKSYCATQWITGEWFLVTLWTNM